MRVCLFACEGAAIRNSFLSFKGLLRTLKVVVCVMASTYLGRETMSGFVTVGIRVRREVHVLGIKVKRWDAAARAGKNKGREVKG